MTIPAADIHSFLRSAAVQDINFSFNSHPVTGHLLDQLANLFSDTPIRGRIRVTTNPAIVGGPRSRTQAAWDPDRDKINVRSDDILDTPVGSSYFLQECVHAIQDWRSVDMRIQVAEGMAYLAQTWYLLNSPPGSVAAVGIPRDMVDVARELRHTYRTTTRVSPAVMTDPQYQRVRQSVLNDYGYRTGFYDNDGIRGIRRLR